MRNIKENLWKKWIYTRGKERKKAGDEFEIDKIKTLEENLGKLEEIKQRLIEEEKKIVELHDKDKIRKRTWRKRRRLRKQIC